jgi:transcription initiation factor TFIID subunit 9B
MSILDDKDTPRDAKLISHVLNSMGVEEYEPRVINQLLEFMYSILTIWAFGFSKMLFLHTNLEYVSDVLQDAQVYSSHAAKSELDLADIRLAIQSRVNFSFTQPPPREVILKYYMIE